MKYSKLKKTKQVRSIIKNSKNKTNRRKKRGLTVKFSKKLRRYKKKTPLRRKTYRKTKRGGSGYDSDSNQKNQIVPMISNSPPRNPNRYENYDSYSDNYSSRSSSSFSTPRTSISSIGDFEIEELDKVRDIVEMIEKYVFSVSNYYSDSFSLKLNKEINKLEVYDLHRKVEYIWNEVSKIGTRVKTPLSEKNIREVITTLEFIIDLIPNTRGNTPIEEFESRTEVESLSNDVSNLSLNVVDKCDHTKDNKYFKGGKRNCKRRSVK
jgi:hypothetical protein